MKYFICIIAFSFILASINGQQIKVDREVTMLALGDSYTIGASVPMNDRWPHQLIDELRAQGVVAEYPDYIATTGWTTANLIQGIQSNLDSEKKYKLVSILIGVNNQYQGLDVSSYEPELKEIIEQALNVTGQEKTRIFILSIPDYAYTPFGQGSSSISSQIDQYNGIKKRVADEYGIAFIDITPISRMGLNIPSLVASDGLHPSGNQYREWVKEVLPRLDVNQSTSDRDHLHLSGNGLKVYPNPAGSTLYVDSPFELERIRLINTLGGVLLDLPVSTLPQKIELPDLAPGIYILRATGRKGQTTYLQKTILIQAGSQ